MWDVVGRFWVVLSFFRGVLVDIVIMSDGSVKDKRWLGFERHISIFINVAIITQ